MTNSKYQLLIDASEYDGKTYIQYIEHNLSTGVKTYLFTEVLDGTVEDILGYDIFNDTLCFILPVNEN